MGKIYMITNVLNNKKYVGQTTNFVSQRFAQHVDSAFRYYKKKKSDLYRDMVSSGENVYIDFKYTILEECDDENLNEREVYWIKKIKSEYNENYKSKILADLYAKEICNMYKNGYTVTEIRIKYRCRHTEIKKILEENHINILKSRPKEEQRKKVYYFDEMGNFIRKYNYIAECANDLGIKQGNPRLCALNNTKKGYLYYTCSGKYFSYKKEQPYIYKIINNKKNIEILCKTKLGVENEMKKLINKYLPFSQLKRKGRKTIYGFEIINMIGDES